MNSGMTLPVRQTASLSRSIKKKKAMIADDRRLLVLPKDRPPRTNVPAAAPIALGEPMQLEGLPWLQWSQNAFALFALSLTRWIGR